MRIKRSLALLTSLAAILLFATVSNAQTFSMTGKAGTGSGIFIKLPAGGAFATPCSEITGSQGFLPPPGSPTNITMTGVVLNPGGCIPGGPANVTTTGGGGFAFSTNFFSQPFPGAIINVPVPGNAGIPQLATSFMFAGPNVGPAPIEPISPVLTTSLPTNYANFGNFKAGAWMTQTNRASSNFTVCPGNLVCTKPSQGSFPAIVKNSVGTDNTGGFGGTMGLVLTTGPNTSSVSQLVGPGIVAFFPLAGMGSRAAGRGYGAMDTDSLMAAPVWAMYTLTPSAMGGTGPFSVIGMVTTPAGTFPMGTNNNTGWPWTTGTITVRGTGMSPGGMTAGGTWRVAGFDTTDTMGQRNIQMVAGHFAQSTIQGPNGTPNYSVMRLPEPGAALQLLAGVFGVLGLGIWRARKAR